MQVPLASAPGCELWLSQLGARRGPQNVLFLPGSASHWQKLAFKAVSRISSWVVQVGVKRSVLHITNELRFC